MHNMKEIELEHYYPAGGKTEIEIEIKSVESTKRDDVFIGVAVLPLSTREKKVVIYQLVLADNSIELRAVSAHCPHQAADISHDKLNQDGNVYCSLHRRPICIFSEYNQAYSVEKRAEQYFITCSR